MLYTTVFPSYINRCSIFTLLVIFQKFLKFNSTATTLIHEVSKTQQSVQWALLSHHGTIPILFKKYMHLSNFF